MRDQLKTGAWLTPERLRNYPALLLAFLFAAAVLLVITAKGDLDRFGRPLGTDFSDIWIAGLEVDQGHPAEPYDRAAHAAEQRAHFGVLDGIYVWPYPPYFLGPAALLGLLPYLAALAVWQFATLALYLVSVFGALRPRRLPLVPTLIAALGFPAVFINLAHGHNGFLTAALLTGGLLLLRRRPLMAGILFALLAYKPHLALVVPAALLAGGHWRTIVAAVAGVAATTLATISSFVVATWQVFFASLSFTRTVILEQGGLGYDKVQSLFAAVRLLGGSVLLAYAIQVVATAITIAALVWLWRSRADDRLKAAALLVGCLLATPYGLDYDMVVLAPAMAFAISFGLEKGFGPFEKSGLAAVWIVPLLARPLAGAICLPLGVLALLLFFAGLIKCALHDGQKSQDSKEAAHRAFSSEVDTGSREECVKTKT
jgi:alpha-1,2-mannosyltransferase